MDALRKAWLGGKTHMGWWWCTGVVAFHMTLLIRGQLHTPVPLFQRTRQKGLSPRCHDFYDAHQEQVELMDEFRKVSLGGKTDPTAAVAGLVAELAVPKVGKALLGRLTGFDGDLKAAPLSR